MKNLILTTALAAALLPLAACNSNSSKPEVVDTNPDPMAAELAKRPKVELPPSMKASKTFRCDDHGLVYVDFFSGDKQAVLRTEKDGAPIKLTAANGGDPLTGGGYTLKGTPASITLTKPGAKAESCKS